MKFNVTHKQLTSIAPVQPAVCDMRGYEWNIMAHMEGITG
jgi:hypothetical protein